MHMSIKETLVKQHDINKQRDDDYMYVDITVGHGGALVESIAFNRRVVGSTPSLAAM